ncbi:hypothetical protein ACIBJC_29305 [Streptomyces sp. NPDC050509]|uniref:hypothetical protein n=1 Tax=Streptomyces sp. NPDC050509 TaxID=3365620 RepID=UPI0037BA28F6
MISHHSISFEDDPWDSTWSRPSPAPSSPSGGVALLGTFTDQGPTSAARASLTALLAALSEYHGFDPQAAVTFVNPVDGVTMDVQMISGHQDRPATECPGAVLHDDLPALRADVASAL